MLRTFWKRGRERFRWHGGQLGRSVSPPRSGPASLITERDERMRGQGGEKGLLGGWTRFPFASALASPVQCRGEETGHGDSADFHQTGWGAVLLLPLQMWELLRQLRAPPWDSPRRPRSLQTGLPAGMRPGTYLHRRGVAWNRCTDQLPIPHTLNILVS